MFNLSLPPCGYLGKDSKRGIMLDEECQVDIESAFYRETVAKKYASLFHSTLHHNTGYFLQVRISEISFYHFKHQAIPQKFKSLREDVNVKKQPIIGNFQ